MISDGIDEANAALVEAFAAIRPRYTDFCDSMSVLLQKLCNGEAIQVTVEARVKEIPSLVEKLKRKPGYSALDEIADLAGVRLIVRYLGEVDQLVKLISHEFTVIESSQHEFESPNAFGYRSYHLVVSLSKSRSGLKEWTGTENLRCEVQIRTILQHAWASISHSLDYKSETDVPARLQRDLFKVAALLESADDSFDRYRTSVVSLQELYAAEVDWRKLPIDAYSLSSHWLKLPQGRLRSAIESVGQKVQSHNSPANSVFAAIARGAAVARLQTLGMLEEYILKTDLADKMRVIPGVTNTVDVGVNPAIALLAAFIMADGVTSADRDYILSNLHE